ncbi:hypothetical protein EV360DRAFT_73735 [Lentinula raphanica]|nr:hypothetical protein EV360DRAFT_73735 [Lentinula raphanica]
MVLFGSSIQIYSANEDVLERVRENSEGKAKEVIDENEEENEDKDEDKPKQQLREEEYNNSQNLSKSNVEEKDDEDDSDKYASEEEEKEEEEEEENYEDEEEPKISQCHSCSSHKPKPSTLHNKWTEHCGQALAQSRQPPAKLSKSKKSTGKRRVPPEMPQTEPCSRPNSPLVEGGRGALPQAAKDQLDAIIAEKNTEIEKIAREFGKPVETCFKAYARNDNVKHMAEMLQVPWRPEVSQEKYVSALLSDKEFKDPNARERALQQQIDWERGEHLESMVDMLKGAVEQMTDGDRKAFDKAWLERLITSATDMGARVPKRTQDDTTDSEKPAAKKLNQHMSSLPWTQTQVVTTSWPAKALLAPKLKQAKLSFIKDTRNEEEKQADHQHRIQRDIELQAEREAKAAAEKKEKKDHEQELARNRQQRRRQKLHNARDTSQDNSDSDADDNEPNQAQEAASSDPIMTQADLATISRPGYEKWRATWNGTWGGKKREKATRTNWFHPFLWAGIDAAMSKANWSCEDAVKIVHCERPELYAKLTRRVIWKWKIQGKNAWTEKTKAKVEEGHGLAGSGQAGALTKYPGLVQQIKDTLQGLRTTGLVVNATLARSIMLGLIQENHPEILNETFQCTEWFVQSFLRSVMDWTPRTGTRAAAHLPADAEDLCERTFFRLVYCMKWENIPAKLVINIDQQGIYVLPNSTKTFYAKGDHQVDIIGKEEKRAFTILVASTATGDFLPIQSVWAGKTDNSLPKHSAAGMDRALAEGFHFAAAASEKSPHSHFSTLKTMKEWIDIYWSPTSRKYQPAASDVGIQHPLKHHIKAILFDWLAGVHREQLAAGAKPEEIQITSSLPKLRDASVAPLVKAYQFMKTF